MEKLKEVSDLISFYKPCINCQGTNIQLIEDVEKKFCQSGGMRAVCLDCGRNTHPHLWNSFNPVTKNDESEINELQDLEIE